MLLILFCSLATQALQHGSHSHLENNAADDPNWSALNADMETMHLAMAAVKPSRNSDIDFVRTMLPHHQGAIDMAKTELMYGKDPQMRRLAQEIITDQQSEIELMRLWLKQHKTGLSRGNPMSP